MTDDAARRIIGTDPQRLLDAGLVPVAGARDSVGIWRPTWVRRAARVWDRVKAYRARVYDALMEDEWVDTQRLANRMGCHYNTARRWAGVLEALGTLEHTTELRGRTYATVWRLRLEA